MAAIWKDIKGYEGLYQVSNFGNVKSMDNEINVLTRWGTYTNRSKKGKILKLLNNNGYRAVILSKHGKTKLELIHRLVGNAFIPNLLYKPQINHKDCNKSNNVYTNLEWCTPSENGIHAGKNGLLNFSRKYPKSMILKIRELYNTGNYTQQKIGDMFDLTQGYISLILSERRWKNV
jgi:hypothetical protein